MVDNMQDKKNKSSKSNKNNNNNQKSNKNNSYSNDNNHKRNNNSSNNRNGKNKKKSYGNKNFRKNNFNKNFDRKPRSNDLESSNYYGVFTKGRDNLTINLNPGIKVYDEKLIDVDKVEYRSWNPRKSKIGAAIEKGMKTWPFNKKTSVLYLGVASGTTASHLSDICKEGIIFGVDPAPRVMRELYFVSENRKNIIPLLEDANHPEDYKDKICKVDVIVQDIAQKNQVEILKRNLIFLKKEGYILLSLKAKSIDITKNPVEIYKKVREELKDFCTIIEEIRLDPFERDHNMFVLKK